MLENWNSRGDGVIYGRRDWVTGSKINACYQTTGREKTELILSATVKIEIEHHR